jgi:hypothetical protein
MADQYANAMPNQPAAFPAMNVNSGQQMDVGKVMTELAQLRMMKQRGLGAGYGLGPGQAAPQTPGMPQT